MDPAESILSMLDYSLDPLMSSSHDAHMDMNLGFDDILSNEFNLLSSNDNTFVSDILNDDSLGSLDFADSLCESDLFQTFASTKNFAARNKAKIKFNATSASKHPGSPASTFKSFSILNNGASQHHASRAALSAVSRSATGPGRVTISMNVPKVYISPSTKKSTATRAGGGTSLLVKSKRASANNKRRSLLLQSNLNSHNESSSSLISNVFRHQKSSIIAANAAATSTTIRDSFRGVIFPSLRDHDYCVRFTSEEDETDTCTAVSSKDAKSESPVSAHSTTGPSSDTARAKSNVPTASTATSASGSMSTQELQNDLEDLLQGFIPDDVLLNELPNCLMDLFNLDSGMLNSHNSEDVLHGLNDACNLMTDHYIEDLEQLYNIDSGFNLPNLDITEDDLNAVTQSMSASSSPAPSRIQDCAAKDIEVDIVYSPFSESAGDSSDCASSLGSTGACTEESSSEDTDCHSRSPIKSKRHRSLSSSSLTSRRKRRFSSRSSFAAHAIIINKIFI